VEQQAAAAQVADKAYLAEPPTRDMLVESDACSERFHMKGLDRVGSSSGAL
jgi:hypothetical protein